MAAPASESKLSKDDEIAVDRFREYLRIKTVHPIPDYESAMVFFKKYADELGLPFERIDVCKEPSLPIALITWVGTEPSLPSVVLNSHTDVVPVVDEEWHVDPWGGDVIDGKIYGRGAQDMKCVGIQYIECVRRLKASGFKPRRTIYLLYVPHEELGGPGMRGFIKHPKFKEMNIGMVMDEGLASPSDKFTVFWGERKIWWIKVTATGPTGHGSRFVPGTAVEKLMRVNTKILAFREEQLRILEAGCGCGKQLGDVTTINLTNLKAGVGESYNVIPTEAYAGFDCRIPCDVDLKVFKAKLDEWTAEEGVSYELVHGTNEMATSNPTTTLNAENDWWKVIKGALDGQGCEVNEAIFPAATDSRFLRLIDIPCFGFSPMNKTPILLHDHNEFLGVDVFVKGIEIFRPIITALASTGAIKSDDRAPPGGPPKEESPAKRSRKA